MTTSYRLVLSYDGTPYFGWQKTKMGPSIQETLQKAIFQVSRQDCCPEAASRTDRGVHAEGQVVQFSLKKGSDPHLLQRALNATLPKDIRVLALEIAPSDFHPTLSATAKEYHYRLSLGATQHPTERLYAWHFRYPLDLLKMERAAQDFLGTHDFSALANEKKENPICRLIRINVQESFPGELQIITLGDRFLYKMVRNLAGTLVWIGSGKLPPDCAQSLLQSKDRKQGGITAPAHGLYLHKVLYDYSSSNNTMGL